MIPGHQNSEITMEGAPALHGGEVELDLGGHFLPEPSVCFHPLEMWQSLRAFESQPESLAIPLAPGSLHFCPAEYFV